ncbi:hypothetical protein GCM10010302_17280 [Streptomyces polychromogenes]|uniref:Uncharacterized protein n=1 Tax=Streptomyces polychromogenes TaxID=67342 RepID=A0ABP3EYH4_9ACTN
MNEGAEPAVAGVVGVDGVPPQGLVDRPGVEGAGEHAQGRREGDGPGQASLDDGDAVGVGHVQGQGQEAVGDRFGLQLEAAFGEAVQHEAGVARLELPQHPPQSADVVRTGCGTGEGVVPVGDDNPFVGEERQARQSAHAAVPGRDQPVRRGGAGLVVHGFGSGELAEPQAGVRCPLLEGGQEPGAEDGHGVVGDVEGELPLGGCGVEVGFGGEEPVGELQDAAGLFLQLLSEGGEAVAVALAYEQVIAEVPTQAREHRAGRRLADPDPLGRAADVPLLEQGLQGDEQVEIRTGHTPRLSTRLIYPYGSLISFMCGAAEDSMA